MEIDANSASYQIAFIILVLLTGGFLKSFTTLQIFRIGLGLYDATIGVIVLIFASILAIFVVDAVMPLSDVMSSLSKSGGGARIVEEQIIPFLEQRTDPERKAGLVQLQEQLRQKFGMEEGEAPTSDHANQEEINGEYEASTTITLALLSFLLEELEGAFQLGLLFIIPFIVIDLLVLHIMQLLQMSQLPAICISLPVKLMLFLVVDGWSLLVQRLVGDYVGG
ncbi:MAG: hypothetical protein ACO3XO_00200 [Bdellovibrionota bacterium]|jgi:type III secretory pathway component EscR